MSTERFAPLVGRLAGAAEALAALCAALELRAEGASPPEARALEAVVDALAGPGALEGVTPAEAAKLGAWIRGLVLQNVELMNHPSRASGWMHTDPRVLSAQGMVSASFPAAFAKVAPSLGDLAARLARPGATFLDVGVGVGWLAMNMCRAFPALDVVGIDPYEPSLALARRNIAESGLDARITLRAQRAEDLVDEAAFDLAWVSVPFLPSAILERATARIHASLRSGGWIVFARFADAEPLPRALGALRSVRNGARVMTTPEAEAFVRTAGFAEVRTLPADAWPPGTLTVAMRAG